MFTNISTPFYPAGIPGSVGLDVLICTISFNYGGKANSGVPDPKSNSYNFL